jgi:uncharacterized protein YegL
VGTETKLNCLPVYVVIDTSGSMSKFEGMLNGQIEALYDALITSPRISDFAYVSIISFNTNAEVVMQMTDLQAMTALPRVGCGGITDFTKVIRLVRQRIDEEVPFLKKSGRQVLRPVAFLLTDGVPTNAKGHQSDEWKADFAQLIDKSYALHPNVVPFGYGQVTDGFLQGVATIPGYAFRAEGDTGQALQKVIPALLNTLIASAADNALRLPAEVDGFIRVSEEII